MKVLLVGKCQGKSYFRKLIIDYALALGTQLEIVEGHEDDTITGLYHDLLVMDDRRFISESAPVTKESWQSLNKGKLTKRQRR